MHACPNPDKRFCHIAVVTVLGLLASTTTLFVHADTAAHGRVSDADLEQ